MPNPNLAATCSAGTCQGFDVSKEDVYSACQSDTDCRLRVGLGCCEGCQSTGYDLVAINVMEKRDGWGGEYPAELRNGEWEYQSFTPAKAVNTKANLKGCFECHKPKDKEDYLFTMQQIKAGK